MSSHPVLNLFISFMKSCTLLSPWCFSNREDVSISGKLFDLFSTHTYDGEGKVSWPEHLHIFISMIHEEDEFFYEHVSFLLAYTLHKSPFRQVLSLPTDTVHSFEHFCDLIEEAFYHFDLDHLD